jgi:thioesterase domain-containing protein
MHDQDARLPTRASNDIPLFYLGGDAASQWLAQSLGGPHRFHRLRIQESVVRELKNPYSLRCIAEYFAKVIRENRPRGPYMLGGWCAHGVLALETAQILREQEQDVALLVLLETINPERMRRQSRLTRIMATAQARMNLFGLEHKYLRSLPKEPANTYPYGRAVPKLKGLRSGVERTPRHRQSREIQLTHSTPLEILYTAVSNYQPRPYDSPVLLIRSRRGMLGLARDAHLGWGTTLGEELEVCETEGNHYTMHAGPNLERLVQKVGESLQNAEQRRQQHIGQAGQTA